MKRYIFVTPCVGVWIETVNNRIDFSLNLVTPCVGVWIETHTLKGNPLNGPSHPAWVCGLKHGL